MRPVGDLLAGDSPWLRRGARVLTWIALLVACYLGGVAATNLAPTVVETSQYRAVLRLDPVPRHTPVLHAPTIVGDVDVQFDSPLVPPGLDVQVAVREEITNLFTRPNVDIRALQPSADEISSAISQAAIGVGIRFLLGATAIAVLLALASHYIRQRTTRRRHVVVGDAGDGRRDLLQTIEADEGVDLRDGLLQVAAVLLDQAAGDDQPLQPPPLPLRDLEDRVDRLLLRGVDEAAGVD